MTKLSDTIAQLAAIRAGAPTGGGSQGRLHDLGGFGSNPGALKARVHVPSNLAERPALVVVLHGCTQDAAGYDRGSGWSQLADEHGFVVLFPEQQRANNPNLCFNWFSPADNGRDRGEALSIRQMIAAMVAAHAIDPARIFVTGLSAGGAMASILLSVYPELFAGGAIIAGLPFGAAANVPQALEAMRSPGSYSGADLGDRIRRASAHVGPWPRISVWHGTADRTVGSANADAIIAQWLFVHGLGDRPNESETIAGHTHRIWTDKAGRTVVEDYRIANMGHGTPLATTGPDACGVVMPHMLEAGISSTRRIAAGWALFEKSQEQAAPSGAPGSATPAPDLPAVKTARLERLPSAPSEAAATPDQGGVEAIIARALRAAGLMR